MLKPTVHNWATNCIQSWTNPVSWKIVLERVSVSSETTRPTYLWPKSTFYLMILRLFWDETLGCCGLMCPRLRLLTQLSLNRLKWIHHFLLFFNVGFPYKLYFTMLTDAKVMATHIDLDKEILLIPKAHNLEHSGTKIFHLFRSKVRKIYSSRPTTVQRLSE